jgi:hypothetical protein
VDADYMSIVGFVSAAVILTALVFGLVFAIMSSYGCRTRLTQLLINLEVLEERHKRFENCEQMLIEVRAKYDALRQHVARLDVFAAFAQENLYLWRERESRGDLNIRVGGTDVKDSEVSTGRDLAGGDIEQD